MEPETQKVLTELEETIHDFWNVRPETAGLLHFLARTIQAKDILELGTSNGYSTIWLADAVRSVGGKVITVDYNPEWQEHAKENLKRAKLSNYVEMVLSPALDALDDLEGPFDFVFLDATKCEYAQYLKKVFPKVRIGGIIAADNVAGMFAAETADFRDALEQSDQIECTYIPIVNSEDEPDALAIARRIC